MKFAIKNKKFRATLIEIQNSINQSERSRCRRHRKPIIIKYRYLYLILLLLGNIFVYVIYVRVNDRKIEIKTFIIVN